MGRTHLQAGVWALWPLKTTEPLSGVSAKFLKARLRRAGSPLYPPVRTDSPRSRHHTQAHVLTLTQRPLLTWLTLPRPPSAHPAPVPGHVAHSCAPTTRLAFVCRERGAPHRPRVETARRMRQLNGPRAASSSGAGMKALSIVKNSATTADDLPCKLRLDRPSASGCRWKRGAEDDGRWRNLPVLASLGRICTVAGLYNGFQRSDESNGERQGGGRSVGARLPWFQRACIQD